MLSSSYGFSQGSSTNDAAEFAAFKGMLNKRTLIGVPRPFMMIVLRDWGQWCGYDIASKLCKCGDCSPSRFFRVDFFTGLFEVAGYRPNPATEEAITARIRNSRFLFNCR